MSNISLLLTNKKVEILDMSNIDSTLAKKLNNLGIYKNQIITLKKIGNTKSMIGIEINYVTNVFRIKDIKNILVREVKNDR